MVCKKSGKGAETLHCPNNTQARMYISLEDSRKGCRIPVSTYLLNAPVTFPSSKLCLLKCLVRLNTGQLPSGACYVFITVSRPITFK